MWVVVAFSAHPKSWFWCWNTESLQENCCWHSQRVLILCVRGQKIMGNAVPNTLCLLACVKWGNEPQKWIIICFEKIFATFLCAWSISKARSNPWAHQGKFWVGAALLKGSHTPPKKTLMELQQSRNRRNFKVTLSDLMILIKHRQPCSINV